MLLFDLFASFSYTFLGELFYVSYIFLGELFYISYTFLGELAPNTPFLFV